MSSDQPKVDSQVQPMSVGATGSTFVINLCSSTSPVALSPPDHAGLKRFTFFVSRRREEGRERFRLHMGYFETQEEAEKLLDIVREIYPGAWAGLAPGQRLRAAAAAAAKEVAVPAVAVTPVAATSVRAPVPQVTSTPPVAASAAPMPAQEVSFELLPKQPALERSSERTVDPRANDAAMPEQSAAARSLSDVRAAIASLADTTTRAPVLQPARLQVIPELKPPVKAVPQLRPVPLELAQELSGEAAMAILESRPQDSEAATKVTDTARAAIAPTPEKAVYAVQLMWSVQPIDIAQVPQLAIFSAYALYGAEGNRDGRRWYGLRLGFFTDAVSAKQVAHYVRSEFSTVSVVPVTQRERERAKVALARPAPAPAVAAVPAKAPSTQFEFIEDKPIVPTAAPAGTKGAPARPAAPGPRTGRAAPGKRAKLRSPAQLAARRAKPKQLTLEETLEILGAGELKVDDGRGALINSETAANAAAPRPPPAKAKPSRLGRLFERLSERIGN